MRGTVYISGQITGLPIEEAQKLFKQAEELLIAYGYKVVNPLTLPHNHGKTWDEYMREDLIAMLNCTHVLMLSNWQQSKGAKIEHSLAKEIGLKIFYDISEN